MITLDAAREAAMALPDATEEPHFDLMSWRVGGKIFATVPGEPGQLRIFLDEDETTEAIAANPGAYSELRWGKRLAGITVRLDVADPGEVSELLETAWRRKAPKRVSR